MVIAVCLFSFLRDSGKRCDSVGQIDAGTVLLGWIAYLTCVFFFFFFFTFFLYVQCV